jgi:hypothetical protein
VDRDGAIAAIPGGHEPQVALLVGLGEILLLVARGEAAALREDPDLEEVDQLRLGGVELAVGHAGPGGHALHIAGLDDGAIAHAIAVLEAPLDDVREDLHVAVRVGAEAAAGLHPVLVDDPELAEPHEAGVMVAGEGEGVVRVEPAVVGVSSLLCAPKLQHGRLS